MRILKAYFAKPGRKKRPKPVLDINRALKRGDSSKRPSRDASGSTLTGLLAAIWS
jgi:hypothetical protein